MCDGRGAGKISPSFGAAPSLLSKHPFGGQTRARERKKMTWAAGVKPARGDTYKGRTPPDPAALLVEE